MVISLSSFQRSYCLRLYRRRLLLFYHQEAFLSRTFLKKFFKFHSCFGLKSTFLAGHPLATYSVYQDINALARVFLNFYLAWKSTLPCVSLFLIIRIFQVLFIYSFFLANTQKIKALALISVYSKLFISLKHSIYYFLR